jgi:hypothetical protein
MADLHNHSRQESSMSKLILIAVAILALLYFLAKGCTNHSEDHTTTPATHGSAVTITTSQQLL